MTTVATDESSNISAESRPVLTWQLPVGWAEKPVEGMRVGSFTFTAKNGEIVDISVIPIAGIAGGELSNVNRWRGQIGLEPIDQAELDRSIEHIIAGDHSMVLTDLVSKESLSGNRVKTRIVAASFRDGETTWFLKMTGEETAVLEAKNSFLQFLSSIRLSTHD